MIASENLLDILRKLYPGIDLEPLQRVSGGRLWYVESLRNRDQAETREAIRRDPCRDYLVICQRYRVSKTLVYSVWNEGFSASVE